jgi:hypothetical protein
VNPSALRIENKPLTQVEPVPVWHRTCPYQKRIVSSRLGFKQTRLVDVADEEVGYEKQILSKLRNLSFSARGRLYAQPASADD